jgi:hypothetical protein
MAGPPMDVTYLRKALEAGRIEWRKHALERMLERGIARDAVLNVLRTCDILKDYPDDVPFPSALFLGFDEAKPLHVVAAIDAVDCVVYVITVYVPDERHFGADFRTRKRS